MKKKHIIFISFIIAIILIVVTFILFVNFMLSGGVSEKYKRDIFQIVNDNKEILLNDIANNDFTNSLKIKGIKSIDADNDFGIIDFYCGGWGIVPSSSYFGFYYTADDKPKPTSLTPGDALHRKGNGYESKYRSNRYYTERIIENFYYYEAHY